MKPEFVNTSREVRVQVYYQCKKKERRKRRAYDLSLTDCVDAPFTRRVITVKPKQPSQARAVLPPRARPGVLRDGDGQA